MVINRQTNKFRVNQLLHILAWIEGKTATMVPEIDSASFLTVKSAGSLHVETI